MDKHFHTAKNPAFNVLRPPEVTTPLVINSPHSGRDYPDSFLEQSRLGNLRIRKSEDFLVDQLVIGATDYGIPLLSANFPRAYIDVNREPYELDQAMFNGRLPDYVNTKSLRVSSGLGTIARIVAEGEPIYSVPLNVEEGLSRVETIYRPYHAALRRLLAETHVAMGSAVLIDCHSMPSNSAPLNRYERRPDFVLGDRFGSSCAANITRYARSVLQQMGYCVEINKPYAGGFITEHYGRPENGLHALQIEINRGLYMDEVRIQPSVDFDVLALDMKVFFKQLSGLDLGDLAGTRPLAAE